MSADSSSTPDPSPVDVDAADADAPASAESTSPSSSYQQKNTRRVSRTFKLPVELVDDLTAYADAHDLSATSVVRAALEAYLHPEDEPISKGDLVRLFDEFEHRLEAVRVEAVPVLPDASPDPADPPKKKGFFRRLFG